MVPGSLGEHLHATVLVLLQTSPQLCSLPFSLHLPIGGIGRKRREEKKKELMETKKWRSQGKQMKKPLEHLMSGGRHICIFLTRRAEVVAVIKSIQV